MTDLPHVVIVGGGFAGLYAAKGLARSALRAHGGGSAKHTCSIRHGLYQVA